ncbi:chemokine-like factor [Trichomycterus rosablanca]|uniref:chemokine-like factor n=1 Tax=Trichomycterus rosablanca TaxID=2290929 RepID=UPI002F3503BA
MEVDRDFLRSKRSILKITEIAVMFVAFLCYAVAGVPPYIAVACLESIVTLALLLLYLLKLHKILTFFFWPLIDAFNSVFAAVFVGIVSVVALSTYTVKATLAGGFLGLVAAVLWSLDGFYIFKKITFNQPTSTPPTLTQNCMKDVM